MDPWILVLGRQGAEVRKAMVPWIFAPRRHAPRTPQGRHSDGPRTASLLEGISQWRVPGPGGSRSGDRFETSSAGFERPAGRCPRKPKPMDPWILVLGRQGAEVRKAMVPWIFAPRSHAPRAPKGRHSDGPRTASLRPGATPRGPPRAGIQTVRRQQVYRGLHTIL